MNFWAGSPGMSEFYIDWSEFSLRTGWGTVYDIGKRIACLSAFLVASSMLLPIWSPGQTELKYEVADNARRIEDLRRDVAGLPTRVALLEQGAINIQKDLSAIKTGQDEINAKLWGAIASFALWAAAKLFAVFGGKITQFARKDNDS